MPKINVSAKKISLEPRCFQKSQNVPNFLEGAKPNFLVPNRFEKSQICEFWLRKEPNNNTGDHEKTNVIDLPNLTKRIFNKH